MSTNRKDYAQRHYQEHKQLYVARALESNKRVRARNKRFIRRVKLRYGCQIVGCGYKKFEGALDFHHLDSVEKDSAIGHLAKDASMKVLKDEMRKCIIVCANCHREIHGGVTEIGKPTSLKTK